MGLVVAQFDLADFHNIQFPAVQSLNCLLRASVSPW
jgi:hypothetical protein